MSYKKIVQRANREKRANDHIVWEGKCVRCGMAVKFFGDWIQERYGDAYEDLRDYELECNSWRCTGRVAWIHRLPAMKALHLNDIKRRK